jgi:hypothetical protein
MRRALLTLSLAALAIIGSVTHAVAQETKQTRGTIASMSGGTITLSTHGGDRQFIVDGNTTIEAVGAGTLARQAKAAGKPGPKLADVLKNGQSVDVTYYDFNGMPHAKRIRRVANR